MAADTKLMTWQEFAALPDDGQRHELIRGEVFTMPLPQAKHGLYAMNIAGPLHALVKRQNLGRVFAAETGFLIERGPDTARGADVAFVARARLPQSGELPAGCITGAPDFLVEVLSPSDTFYATGEKVDMWLAAGASLIWVVNPRQKSVTVDRRNSLSTHFSEADALDASDVVPGFTMHVADIFA